ncbi:hypothetical protein CSHISOI_00884 [Colletotrichum shisoi]|uniref:Uncharacterized protein n=1 Tax=Colletotrichum shisoi TaxID=2078593 RepID=A0A5Q4C7D1_9PEZI|nr:hypothetical protein CSHISOI_00884 [Colletotrichum shisoi]
MSSSLARTRSLRKPTQGSSTDLPPTSISTLTVTTAPAAAPAPPTTSTQRPVSPSRLPAPRPLAATRPTTRSVSGASVASTKSGVSDAAGAAAKKKRANPLSTLLGRTASTRQTPGTTSATRPRDAAAAAAAAGGPPSAPPSRTSALSGPTRPSSTREPPPTRPRHPPAPSSSSSSTTAGVATGTRPTTATTRPTTSGGVPSSKLTSAASSATSSPTKGHARARSVATLNGSTILRPPGQPFASDRTTRSRPTSLYGAPPTSTSTGTTTTTAAATRPRPPSATDRLSTKPSPVSSLSSTTTSSTTTAAAATTTTRTRPSRTASTSTAPAKPHQQARPPSSSSHSPTSPPRQPPKPAAGALRPFFNTLQQHYSPAKSLAPKPLTATYLAPPSPSKLPSNVALSAETARLQTELLQLHLLHRDLPQTTAAWHASARDKLAARHASLGRSAAALARQEAEAAERLNIAALRRWGSHHHHQSSSSSSSPATIAVTTLEDKVQRLDALLASLWSLDTPGGKHHRLVRAFERWASALPDLEAARARAEDEGDPEALLDADSQVRFGGALDARWKEDAAALVRKLESWRAQLRELEYRDEEESDDDGGKTWMSSRSSLERVLDGCGSLIRDMLDELAVMEEIEAVAVERETEWIRRMNRQGEDGRGKDTPRAGAVWRVV